MSPSFLSVRSGQNLVEAFQTRDELRAAVISRNYGASTSYGPVETWDVSYRCLDGSATMLILIAHAP